MKTTTILIVCSIGLLNSSIIILVSCVLLAAYLFFKWKLKKDIKIHRSESSFCKLMNEECECISPCNEYCSNSKNFKI